MRADSTAERGTPVRFVIVTLDHHLSSATERARALLAKDLPGLALTLHASADWESDPAALERCRSDIERADIVVTTMMFLDDQIQAILPSLQARRDACDAMVGCMSSGEVVKLTRLGRLRMGETRGGPMALLKRLRPKKDDKSSAGAQQMAMLRRLPKILRYVPGTAQDLRAYFLTLQYWLGGSEENVANLVRYLVDRYAEGPRRHLRGTLKPQLPLEYPEVGVYHPQLRERITERADRLPRPAGETRGRVGVLVMRSYLLAGNAAHYDGVIQALEAKGLQVIPAFSSGLDGRPAIERFFMKDGAPAIDALISLTGFALVGGPAYNDARAAEEVLAKLDVPYIAAHPAELQTLEQWGASERGLLPVESTIMVALPELDGATGSILFGGRADHSGTCTGCERGCRFPPGKDDRDTQSCPERAEMLAARVARLVALRRSERAERRIGVVLFNFPPNAGATGTAAFLSVFGSLWRTLVAMKQAGYRVDLPADEEELRTRLLEGNATRFGADANVHARIPVDDHVRRERHLVEIERQWGPAPGKQQSDGSSLFVLGERFGNVFVGVQPGFGYEGDPMRLLFEKAFAPTHAFSAFYRWLREDFRAHAVLHFGTHGALEFMPGKQAGLSAKCWPDRLIQDLPNLYLYAANNPSEGTLAKRRGAATLISYMTPPVTRAGLYRGLLDLKGSLERFRSLEPEADRERADLAELIQAQAAQVELASAEPVWGEDAAQQVLALTRAVHELETSLIPHGLHVVGVAPSADERIDLLLAAADAGHGLELERSVVASLVGGETPDAIVRRLNGHAVPQLLGTLTTLAALDRSLVEDHEIPGILKALDGRYICPAPGGDILRTPEVLPTGRNVHGFDPFRIPSAFAVADGVKQADRLLRRHLAEGNKLPASVAMVLWGTDNLKSEGQPIAQALALLGARPRFDSYGRLSGAQLVPLAELGRARVDVVLTLSGIFRDLMPLQTRMLAEACWLAASADEPLEQNFVRRHALAYAAKHGCDLETAALRVFSNADGTYGANVNHLIDQGCWTDEGELAETYSRRKCFAYGRDGRPARQAELLQSVLGDVQLAYQNLESVELGVTTVDQYFDSLGGISRAVARARGGDTVPVYIGDQTRGEGTVRTLGEQVALETRTRALNPKWYEGMLQHGYEGVRQIEAHVTNTMGWSATTGQVAPWVYQQLSETFVLDAEMRERLAKLNPKASAKVASRLIEAHERRYWTPDAATLEALREAGDALDDRLEGVVEGVAA